MSLLPKDKKSTYEIHLTSSWKHLYGISKPSRKDRAKIYIRVRSNKNFSEKMTQSIYLTTQCWDEKSRMMLKKKVLIIDA